MNRLKLNNISLKEGDSLYFAERTGDTDTLYSCKVLEVNPILQTINVDRYGWIPAKITQEWRMSTFAGNSYEYLRAFPSYAAYTKFICNEELLQEIRMYDAILTSRLYPNHPHIATIHHLTQQAAALLDASLEDYTAHKRIVKFGGVDYAD